MSLYGSHPPIRLANDPSDPVWQWFVYNGPHGERFTWHSEHATARSVEILAQFIDQLTEDDQDFPAKAREVALQALGIEDEIMQRTAIQVLCVVGSDEDLRRIEVFLEHPRDGVVKDARACLFERGFRKRRTEL